MSNQAREVKDVNEIENQIKNEKEDHEEKNKISEKKKHITTDEDLEEIEIEMKHETSESFVAYNKMMIGELTEIKLFHSVDGMYYDIDHLRRHPKVASR